MAAASAALDAEFRKAVEEKKLPAVGALALDASGKELFRAAYGTTSVGTSDAPPFTTDTPVLIFSCTKLVTSIAALQLLEQGKLALDDPVEKYVPAMADLQVLTGLDDDGKPVLRAPSKKPTILNLMTHTSGLTYDFFDKDTLAWRIAVGQNPAEYIVVSALENYKTPLRHDPGADFTYGINSDWLGIVIAKVSGMTLDAYFQKYILQPLGMTKTGLNSQQGDDWLKVHMKDETGGLTPNVGVRAAADAEVAGGGHCLTSTLEDYAQLLLTVLHNGTHPNGTKILEAQAVKDYLFTDFIPQICSSKEVGVVGSSIPQMSNEGELLPAIAKGWSLGLMLNNDDLPNGRPKGCGAWAGLGNLFYWIDPVNGKVAIIATSVLPFMDAELLRLADAFERTLYGKDIAAAGKSGSNYMLTKVLGS